LLTRPSCLSIYQGTPDQREGQRRRQPRKQDRKKAPQWPLSINDTAPWGTIDADFMTIDAAGRTLDPANPNAGILMIDDTGITQAVFPNGDTHYGKAPTDGFSANAYQDSSTGIVSLTIQGQSANPLVPFSPPIQYTINLLIDPSTNQADATIDHTLFPSYQVFQDGVPVFDYLEQGDGFNLYHQTIDTFSTHPTNQTGQGCN
jgi:hypothetical protein